MYLLKQHPWNPGYALPRNVLAEPPGEGVYVTGYTPRKTISSLQPSWFRTPKKGQFKVIPMGDTDGGIFGSRARGGYGVLGDTPGGVLGNGGAGGIFRGKNGVLGGNRYGVLGGTDRPFVKGPCNCVSGSTARTALGAFGDNIGKGFAAPGTYPLTESQFKAQWPDDWRIWTLQMSSVAGGYNGPIATGGQYYTFRAIPGLPGNTGLAFFYSRTKGTLTVKPWTQDTLQDLINKILDIPCDILGSNAAKTIAEGAAYAKGGAAASKATSDKWNEAKSFCQRNIIPTTTTPGYQPSTPQPQRGAPPIIGIALAAAAIGAAIFLIK